MGADREKTMVERTIGALLTTLLLLGALAVLGSSPNEDEWEEADVTVEATALTGSTVGYTFDLTLATARFSDTPGTISAQLAGILSGKDTLSDWGDLGNDWRNVKMGNTVTKRLSLSDVGDVKELILRTDSTNGVKFEKIVVTRDGSTAASFDTSGKFVRCRSKDWFGTGEKKKSCGEKFQVSTATVGGGIVSNCAKHKTKPSPITSTYTSPVGGQTLEYSGFTVYMNCSLRAAYRFEYTADNDCGKLERKSGFGRDPKLTNTCQQKNGKAYPTTDGISFDRGHQVPANHLDDDPVGIAQSNYMTNILPQAANMNRGSWLQSEEIVECLRVTEALYVLGGAVFNTSDPRYDWFMASHGVPNPSFFWKIIKATTLHLETGNYLAMWFPNSELATRAELDGYVLSIDDLEEKLAKFGQPQVFDIPATTKAISPTAAWALPSGCDKQR